MDPITKDLYIWTTSIIPRIPGQPSGAIQPKSARILPVIRPQKRAFLALPVIARIWLEKMKWLKSLKKWSENPGSNRRPQPWQS